MRTGDTASRDTDTRDPNMVDVLVPSGQSQATVLGFAGLPVGGSVVLPYVALN